ncbi:unnamed protein product [Toxocara canis]|uniref:Uncharacterized protein n=1 Tax=Toxocara canis TaxID=6265 RepID=A0A183UZD8_TOXCA|nr:unnamed protein product [Toxocara canis]
MAMTSVRSYARDLSPTFKKSLLCGAYGPLEFIGDSTEALTMHLTNDDDLRNGNTCKPWISSSSPILVRQHLSLHRDANLFSLNSNRTRQCANDTNDNGSLNQIRNIKPQENYGSVLHDHCEHGLDDAILVSKSSQCSGWHSSTYEDAAPGSCTVAAQPNCHGVYPLSRCRPWTSKVFLADRTPFRRTAYGMPISNACHTDGSLATGMPLRSTVTGNPKAVPNISMAPSQHSTTNTLSTSLHHSIRRNGDSFKESYLPEPSCSKAATSIFGTRKGDEHEGRTRKRSRRGGEMTGRAHAVANSWSAYNSNTAGAQHKVQRSSMWSTLYDLFHTATLAVGSYHELNLSAEFFWLRSQLASHWTMKWMWQGDLVDNLNTENIGNENHEELNV